MNRCIATRLLCIIPAVFVLVFLIACSDSGLPGNKEGITTYNNTFYEEDADKEGEEAEGSGNNELDNESSHFLQTDVDESPVEQRNDPDSDNYDSGLSRDEDEAITDDETSSEEETDNEDEQAEESGNDEADDGSDQFLQAVLEELPVEAEINTGIENNYSGDTGTESNDTNTLVFKSSLKTIREIDNQVNANTEGDVIPIRLDVEYGSTLGVAWFPEFQYNTTDKSGGWGTVTDLGDGKGYVSFLDDSLSVEPLEFIPGIIPWTDAIPGTETIRVEIFPNEMSGEIDFCTGEISMDFDAMFQTRMELIEPFYGMVDEIIVICDLTTGVSTGQSHSLEGSLMEDNGRLTLAGVAVVPETGDILVNTLLTLPSDARVMMNARFDFPEGRLECPDADPIDPNVTMSIGRQGIIGFQQKNQTMEQVRYIDYDGKDALFVSEVGELDDDFIGEVNFNSSEVNIPDVDLNPFPLGIDLFSINITSLTGTINYCSGDIELNGTVEYTHKIFGVELPNSKKVVEVLFTTGTAQGSNSSTNGEVPDEYGDGVLAAIEPIQIGKWPFSQVIDVILELPFNLKVDKDMDLCTP